MAFCLEDLGLKDRLRHRYASDISRSVRRFLEDHFTYDTGVHSSVAERAPVERGTVDVYSAGFPCQPFSLAGRQGGAADEAGRGLVGLQVVKKISQERPTCFVLENVAPLYTHKKHRPLLLAILQKLAKLLNRDRTPEYKVEWKVLTTSDYGVPQDRKRLYIIGYRRASVVVPFVWPRKSRTCADIDDLLDPIDPLLVKNHQYPTGLGQLERLHDTLADIKKRGGQPNSTTYLIDIDGSKKFKLSYSDSKCMCLTRTRAGCGGWWVSTRHRRMTTNEMLRFQGLPDRIAQTEISNRQLGLMIGNSWSGNVVKRIMYNLLQTVGLAKAADMQSA